MAQARLTERQRKILDFIIDYYEDHGYPPSIREIGKQVGITSTSVVNYNLNRLVELGLLAREKNTSRGIRLTDKLIRATRALGDVVRIPKVGRIFASEPVPLPAIDSPVFSEEEAIEISRDLLSSEEGLYALEVRGDSMIDSMINEGDIVIMRRDPNWRNGDMVAVWLKDREETTLKHIYREGDRIRLQPANPTMKPIVIDDPENVEVQGKVVLVLRQLE